MSASLPFSLMVAWIMFFGFINTHQRHAQHFQGASRSYEFALYISVALGCLIGLGLLVFYFIRVAWYWPIVLFVIGSAIGGLLFGLLDAIVGELVMSILAFVGWPAMAAWAYFIIRGLSQ